MQINQLRFGTRLVQCKSIENEKGTTSAYGVEFELTEDYDEALLQSILSPLLQSSDYEMRDLRKVVALNNGKQVSLVLEGMDSSDRFKNSRFFLYNTNLDDALNHANGADNKRSLISVHHALELYNMLRLRDGNAPMLLRGLVNSILIQRPLQEFHNLIAFIKSA